MATTISEAGGKWHESATWEGGVVPGPDCDVAARADGASGQLLIEGSGAACKSLNLADLEELFVLGAGLELCVGFSTRNPAVPILSFGSSTTLSVAGTIRFGGTTLQLASLQGSAALEITMP
jgi:hypothetical protein